MNRYTISYENEILFSQEFRYLWSLKWYCQALQRLSLTHALNKINEREREIPLHCMHYHSILHSVFEEKKETNKSEKERLIERTRDERGGIIDNIQIIKMYDKELRRNRECKGLKC